MKKRLTLVTTVCGRFFYFYEKNVWLCNQLLMTEGQSYSTSANYVTWPSTWHLRGLNLPSSFQTKSYLCYLSKSRIYTTFYLREILIATRYYFIILVCWALKWLISNNNRQKTNLVNMDASYVNYFTVPLQSYSLHRFLLSHWRRSDHWGYFMLHRLPCRSTLLCKQVRKVHTNA